MGKINEKKLNKLLDEALILEGRRAGSAIKHINYALGKMNSMPAQLEPAQFNPMFGSVRGENSHTTALTWMAIATQHVSGTDDFSTVHLKRYLPEYHVSFAYSGNSELTVAIDGNGVAAVTKPTSSWTGEEEITFTATSNATGKTASTTVTYTGSA